MKKAILRVLLLVFGLNVFAACYGPPISPEDWPEPTPDPEEQEQTKSALKPFEDSMPEKSDSTCVSGGDVLGI